MEDFRDFGYNSEDEFLEDILCLDEDWTLDDYMDSYDPD